MLPLPALPIGSALQERYINRELALLAFQERVLALAADATAPLLERLKFIAIVSSNLDEFFQVRVSGLIGQQRSGADIRSVDGMTASEQLEAIRERVATLVTTQDDIFLDQLIPALEKERIAFVRWDELSPEERSELTVTFEEQMFPVLTPLAVDPAHPFPYISNLSLNLAVLVRDPATDTRRFARVKIPPVLPRFVPLSDGERFVPLEQVVAAHLPSLFPGNIVEAHFAFRVTRNADFAVEEDEADDLLAAMENVLYFRQRSASAVRLEVEEDITDEVLGVLTRELDLAPEDVTVHRAPLGLSALLSIHNINRPDLKDEPWVPTTQRTLAPSGETVDFFAKIRQQDILVHHPYESFGTSTAAFLAQAVRDPNVLAIKQTLYRTSAADDPAVGGERAVVQMLREAAMAGKQVVVLVELKARFDEAANINWARMLEDSGAHVAYGVTGLKTHAKILLVVRREEGGVRRYAHLGTGNYNPKTAVIYEDLGLFTADEAIGADLSELFNSLTGYGAGAEYRKLLVAPARMRDRLIERIRNEAALGTAGKIVFKINHITDPAVIDELYAASQAGTEIELIVRGICSIRAGVPGLSENIKVRSIVGRFLEHSRIYRFGRPGRGAVYYMGSADVMQRNLGGRVESLVPVTDESLQARIEEILDTLRADDVLAWELTPDGEWHKVPTDTGIDTHTTMQQLALQRSKEAPA
ncbi:MAG: polyphosphate kinase 1 [Acidimicrobiia bacterium]|nr:polyphosphate kinase 1 [Acidimicrobiia bacterium]